MFQHPQLTGPTVQRVNFFLYFSIQADGEWDNYHVENDMRSGRSVMTEDSGAAIE